MWNKELWLGLGRELTHPGETVVCAVSGGADSIAMLFAFYLNREKLGIRLEAAHFNHQLRGEESDRDEAFVRDFCDRYDIPLHVGRGTVKPGKKGLEAAAREARYAFFDTLPGKIATAHTADDNAETVLIHLIRGTGLKGLGGIAPVQGRIIRPMLGITRQEVEGFLEEWGLQHVEDSSNGGDDFLRNRLRHHVMPLLKAENPRLAQNLSRMAQALREDEAYLSQQAAFEAMPTVTELKAMPRAIRYRVLERFLQEHGVKEPGSVQLEEVNALLYSGKPSARKRFPGGLVIAREYDRLIRVEEEPQLEERELPCPGETSLPGLRVICEPAAEILNTATAFSVRPQGKLILRQRRPGDEIRLPGGRKSLKKLYIDRKIPAAKRGMIPVVQDEMGILGVYSIGGDMDRAAKELPAYTVRFIKIENEGETGL